MKVVRFAVWAAVASLPAIAFAKKDEAAASPALRAGVNVPCLEKIVKGDAPTPEAWITLGELDQVRGDLKSAFEKYRKAFGAGAKDLANAPIDFTLVSDAVWIQDAKCPVPVPPAGADAKDPVPATAKGPDAPAYPSILTKSFRNEGNTSLTAVIGPDGHALRVHVTETTAGPSPIDRKRDPGEEDAERLQSRVQFALVSMLAVRTHKFADGSSGKIFSAKYLFKPPNDMLDDGALPGKPDTSFSKPSTGGSGAKVP